MINQLKNPTQAKGMFKGLTKEETSWIMFDWADSAYTMTVLTVVFSMFLAYSVSASGADSEHVSVFVGFGNTAVTLIAGLMAPILGTLSGYHGKKKILFNFFTFLGIASTVALAIVPYDNWFMLLIVFIISGIGFNACNKIYDAFLPDVSSKANMDRVSSLGFGMGYIGGALGFILSIVLLILSLLGVVDIPVVTAYRLSFVITAIWWGVFSIPMFKNVKQRIGIAPEKNYVRKSFAQILTTLKDIAKDKRVVLFLIAFFLYSDGVGSIIRMAVAVGGDLGIDQMVLLAVLLVVQFVAFPCAIAYGHLAKRFGAKTMIYVGIATYCIICVVALFMDPYAFGIEFVTAMFWVLAVLVGTAQGGIQALSRSYFARIIPTEKSNEYFGIYNVFGRFASIIGTTLFGIVSLATGQPHLGISVIAVLFITAAIIFKFVPNDKSL
ncbi:MAG: MFS transporter [Turicibacter sp.]|nr:MFS transporter [Turicibacter sp.]